MKKSIPRLIGALAGLLFGAGVALASDTDMHSTEMKSEIEMEYGPDTIVMLGDLELSDPFTRATPPSAKTGGGFMTITNSGEADDRLVSVTSPAAAVVELHLMTMENEVMVMRSSPEGFVIPAGESVKLAPGGKHLMFMQLGGPFVEGAVVPVTLVFERAGSVDLELPVAPIGAKSFVPE